MAVDIQSINLRDGITKNTTWAAFDYIFSETDWRLRIQCLSPLSFTVVYDDAFALCLSGCRDWQSKHEARTLIATRVLELASSFDKTFIRRCKLQLPDTHEGRVAEALLANLERRIRNTILDELVEHFDTSIHEWERGVQVAVARIDDPDSRRQAGRYVGLDQLVSVDAARKAIRFVFDRTNWHLIDHRGRAVLNPDHRFEKLRSQRSALDEETRARSLVARCIEVLFEAHVEETRLGVLVAPMTRARLRAEVDRVFQEKGVWGLVDLSLPRDRERHYLRVPTGFDAELQGFLDKQEARMVAC